MINLDKGAKPMNAIVFIQQYGIEKARKVVEGVPEAATAFNIVSGSIIYYQLCDNWWWWYNPLKKEWEMDYSKSMRINLSDLKRIVESVDFINKFDGIDLARAYDKEMGSHGFDPFFEKSIADYQSIYSNEMGTTPTLKTMLVRFAIITGLMGWMVAP